jgi:sulfate/thiosulfate-binding protein
MKVLRKLTIGISLFTLLLAACSTGGTATNSNVKLVLAAYSTPREAYGEIIPLFQDYWRKQTGQTVTFEESYQGSGAQARAVIGGFEADVVALSMEGDVTTIVKAGLITGDWTQAPDQGIVTTSVVALAVRAGNPKNITDWADLAKPGLQVLTPNPQTSGGAMWNVMAMYGAALRGQIQGVPAGDAAAAQQFLVEVLRNVTSFDKDARTSITNFEQGVGDVAITYENEVLVGQEQGQNYQLIIPSSTILIENPVAVVDVYADKHGTRKVADAFVNFLFTPQAQQVFAKHGLRSVDADVARQTASQYPAVKDLFTIADFGGWEKVTPEFFGENGIYTQAVQQAMGGTQ